MTATKPAGWLEWAIKDSFLAYLEGIGASFLPSEGAGRQTDGALRFPVAIRTDQSIQTAGTVRIEAHGGALSLEISRPALRIDRDSGWVLEWAVDGVASPRARLLDAAATWPTEASHEWRIEDVALTADGASLFGGSYGPWTRMAPIRILPG